MSMPPNMLADYYLKAGIAQARFGRFGHAEALLGEALKVGREAKLNELVFRVERIKTGLRDCEAEICHASVSAAEPVGCDSAVREVAASLALLPE